MRYPFDELIFLKYQRRFLLHIGALFWQIYDQNNFVFLNFDVIFVYSIFEVVQYPSWALVGDVS